MLNGLLGLTYRWHWGRIFSEDEGVISLVATLFFVMVLYTTADSIKCVGMGIMRGCGRPVPTVWGNFLSCLVAGYPISYVLGFPVGWGLVGIWLGMSFAWVCAGSLYTFFLIRTDWQEQANLAADRNAHALSTTHEGDEMTFEAEKESILLEEDEEQTRALEVS